jgi:hypothetical protein
LSVIIWSLKYTSDNDLRCYGGNRLGALTSLKKLPLSLSKALLIILAVLAQDGFTKRKCLVGLLHLIYIPCHQFHSMAICMPFRFFKLNLFAAKRIKFIILVAINKSLFGITGNSHLRGTQWLCRYHPAWDPTKRPRHGGSRGLNDLQDGF